MKKINRLVIYILAAIILLGAGFWAGYQTSRLATPKPSVHVAENVSAPSAVIRIKDGSQLKEGRIVFSKNETVFSLLQKFTKAKHIEMASTGSGKMAYVTSLNNKKASKSAGWLFSVNGKQPNVGAGAIKVQKNDQIVWNYSKF